MDETLSAFRFLLVFFDWWWWCVFFFTSGLMVAQLLLTLICRISVLVWLFAENLISLLSIISCAHNWWFRNGNFRSRRKRWPFFSLIFNVRFSAGNNQRRQPSNPRRPLQIWFTLQIRHEEMRWNKDSRVHDFVSEREFGRRLANIWLWFSAFFCVNIVNIFRRVSVWCLTWRMLCCAGLKVLETSLILSLLLREGSS